MYLANMVGFLTLFSSLTSLAKLCMYLLRRLYNGEPLYETTGHIGTPEIVVL